MPIDPYLQKLENRIERQEALDAVLRSLEGIEYAIALLILEGYTLKDIEDHFEWDRKQVYHYWNIIKRKGRIALRRDGHMPNNSRDRLDFRSEGERLTGLPASTPDPLRKTGRHDGKEKSNDD